MINIKEFLGLAYYTSDLDKFLAEFDKNHHKMSASQRKEVEKYQRIFASRDQAKSSAPKDTFWDAF